MFVSGKDCAVETLDNGVTRRIKGYIDDLMIVELTWKKGMTGTVHAHPHRQCVYIIEGSFETNLDGEKRILDAGDCMYVETDLPHGLAALSDGVILDIFTPMRKDFVKSN